MFKKKLGQRGFTLIELLVVIAIIGILSSVVLVSLNSSRMKARDAKRIADIGGLQQALALYYDSNSSYPATLAALAPTYMTAEPKDPVSNVGYWYTPGDSGQSYHLGATMEQSSANVLSTDRDCSSLVAAGCFTAAVAAPVSPSTTGGFDGASALVYDVTP